MLYNLRHTVREELGSKRIERIGIANNKPRLMKQADKILSSINIDSGLSADRTVRL